MNQPGPPGYRIEIGLLVEEGNDPRCIGSGTLIGLRHVLTARHVVVGQGRDTVHDKLRVRVGPDEQEHRAGEWVTVTRDAVHLPPDGGDLDVAVIVLNQDLPAVPLELRAERLEENQACSVAGYPRLRPLKSSGPAKKLVSTRGMAYAHDGHTDTMQLSFDKEGQDWKNLSGAAIRIGDHVVGVLRGHPEDLEETRIKATHVSAFIGENWFQAAMGWGDARQPVKDFCAGRVGEVAQLLDHAHSLREALFEELKNSVESDENTPQSTIVARALLAEHPAKIAELVAVAAEEVRKKNSSPVRAGPAILRSALSTSAERGHQARLVQIHAEVRAGQREHKLPAWDPLATEAYLAGAERRGFSVVPREGQPRLKLKLKPTRLLDPPAAPGAPLRNCATLTKDAITQQIEGRFGGHGRRALFDLLDAGIDSVDARGRMKRAFEGEGRGALRKQHAWYVLVVDRDYGDKALADHAYEVLKVALADMPHVRVVRNTATDDATVVRDGALRDYAERTHAAARPAAARSDHQEEP